MGQITVFSGLERRRRWSNGERLHIPNEAFSPGACVAEVCRRHDISTALIYTWRRKIREAQAEPAQDMRIHPACRALPGGRVSGLKRALVSALRRIRAAHQYQQAPQWVFKAAC